MKKLLVLTLAGALTLMASPANAQTQQIPGINCPDGSAADVVTHAPDLQVVVVGGQLQVRLAADCDGNSTNGAEYVTLVPLTSYSLDPQLGLRLNFVTSAGSQFIFLPVTSSSQVKALQKYERQLLRADTPAEQAQILNQVIVTLTGT